MILMTNAIMVDNNAFTAVLLQDGSWIHVDREVMQDYLSADAADYLSNWHGDQYWDGDDIMTAAGELGEVIAYYRDGKLIITDYDAFDRRKEFFLGE